MQSAISVSIGVLIAAVLIAATLWWSFRPQSSAARSILPDAQDNRHEIDGTIITGSGNDQP